MHLRCLDAINTLIPCSATAHARLELLHVKPLMVCNCNFFFLSKTGVTFKLKMATVYMYMYNIKKNAAHYVVCTYMYMFSNYITLKFRVETCPINVNLLHTKCATFG